MNDVGADDLHAHHLVDRHHHFVVDRQQPRLLGLTVLVLQHQRVKFELRIRIAVAPEPLLAGDLHRHFGRRDLQLIEQQAERRHRDRHQDQHRHHGPDHLYGGVVRGARRHRVGARVEFHDHDRQQGKHEQDNRGGQPEQEVMEPDDVVHDRRRRRLQPEFPWGGLAEAGQRDTAAGDNGHARDHESDQPLEHQHCSMRSLDEKFGLD